MTEKIIWLKYRHKQLMSCGANIQKSPPFVEKSTFCASSLVSCGSPTINGTGASKMARYRSSFGSMGM